ncbi:hypothetical protein H7Y21_03380 [Arenimonas sp.]|nr:hypothetical protein [Candidatus Parcubacteria bacterium]
MYFITLKRSWEFLDASDDTSGKPGWRKTIVEAGTYEAEKIPSPFGYYGYWFVLKGTLIGWGERNLRLYEDLPTEDGVTIVMLEQAA